MASEEELSQSMEELEMAKMRLDNMSKEAELLQMSINEHVRAIETLKAYAKTGDGKDILIPVGAGTFIPARSTGSDRTLVAIGSGLSVEKKLDDAVAALEKAAGDIEMEERKLLQEMKNLEKEAQLLSQRVQAISQVRGGDPEEGGHEHQPKRPGRKKDEEE